jgi:hypothetical protein
VCGEVSCVHECGILVDCLYVCDSSIALCSLGFVAALSDENWPIPLVCFRSRLILTRRRLPDFQFTPTHGHARRGKRKGVADSTTVTTTEAAIRWGGFETRARLAKTDSAELERRNERFNARSRLAVTKKHLSRSNKHRSWRVDRLSDCSKR